MQWHSAKASDVRPQGLQQMHCKAHKHQQASTAMHVLMRKLGKYAILLTINATSRKYSMSTAVTWQLIRGDVWSMAIKNISCAAMSMQHRCSSTIFDCDCKCCNNEINPCIIHKHSTHRENQEGKDGNDKPQYWNTAANVGDQFQRKLVGCTQLSITGASAYIRQHRKIRQMLTSAFNSRIVYDTMQIAAIRLPQIGCVVPVTACVVHIVLSADIKYNADALMKQYTMVNALDVDRDHTAGDISGGVIGLEQGTIRVFNEHNRCHLIYNKVDRRNWNFLPRRKRQGYIGRRWTWKNVAQNDKLDRHGICQRNMSTIYTELNYDFWRTRSNILSCWDQKPHIQQKLW